jgi:hypothetical protein
VTDGLIEGGADLKCKISADCKSIQQEIEGRIQKTHPLGAHEVVAAEYVRAVQRVKAALLKRGFIWLEATPQI